LRFETRLSSEEYVTQRGWEAARLEQCPVHPEGGCRFEVLGTYARKTPPGARVRRWCCRTTNQTFSLLPDCLAARMRGSLADTEAAVAKAESTSREAAAEALRPDIGYEGSLRWLRRRVAAVRRALQAVMDLGLERFALVSAPSIAAFRACLGTSSVLVALRGLVETHLALLPSPLGFSTESPGHPRRSPHSPSRAPPERPGGFSPSLAEASAGGEDECDHFVRRR
jgi:hypothetical protein